MFSKLLSIASTLKLMVFSLWRSLLSSFYLKKVYFNFQANEHSDSVILVLVIKDEADRLPYFLDYYRALGVGHFFILDNLSSDDLTGIVKKQSDVSLFTVSQPYQKSRYGIDWINLVARKYCLGRWVLSVDSDEFLVYPHMETRSLRQLCAYLDDSNLKKLYTPMIDMYGKESVMDTHYRRYDNPLDKCCFFDGAGYFTVTSGMGDPWTRGGVRMRVFNSKAPLDSPAINKFSLLKWDRVTFYYRGAHTILPKRRNKMLSKEPAISGALLHFKFFSDLYDKAVFAVENGNHYEGSVEYQRYLNELETLKEPLVYSKSVKYKNFTSLVDHGIVVQSDWI